MTINEFKEVCKSKFYYERLSSKPANKELISSFHAIPVGEEFEKDFHRVAWKEDESGECIYYLIKDRNTNQIVLFFAVQCGLIYMDTDSKDWDSMERSFFEVIIKNQLLKEDQEETLELWRQCYLNDGVPPDGLDEVIKYAREYEEHIRSKDSGKVHEVRNVHISYPCIELALFVRNADYKNPFAGYIPLGVVLFWEIIADKMLELHEMIGSRWLYLFAADEDPEKHKKLIMHYMDSLKFSNIPAGYAVIRPDVEFGYPCLVQKFDDLKINRENIWEQYQDIIENINIT